MHENDLDIILMKKKHDMVSIPKIISWFKFSCQLVTLRNEPKIPISGPNFDNPPILSNF